MTKRSLKEVWASNGAVPVAEAIEIYVPLAQTSRSMSPALAFGMDTLKQSRSGSLELGALGLKAGASCQDNVRLVVREQA